ncbi:hypothetical protein V5799_010955 [Amblyomma americanum]|uniref:Uncharacterized protein n=1 Tax=Amblyomma americanum TaxID=6943 RepID=A0AAQ4EJA5_AMBAM
MHNLLFASDFKRDVPGTLDAARLNVQKSTATVTPVLQPKREILQSIVPTALIAAFEEVSEPAAKVEPVREIPGFRSTEVSAQRVTGTLKTVGADRRGAVSHRGVPPMKRPATSRDFKDKGRFGSTLPGLGLQHTAFAETTEPSVEGSEPVREPTCSPEHSDLPYMASVFGENFTAGNIWSFLSSNYGPRQNPDASKLSLSDIIRNASAKNINFKREMLPAQLEKSSANQPQSIWGTRPASEDTTTPSERPTNLTWLFLVMVTISVVLMVTMYVTYVVNMARLEKARAALSSKPSFPADEI